MVGGHPSRSLAQRLPCRPHHRPLFLAQSIGGFALAAVIVASRRLLPALAGVGFLASTIGGFVWSVEWGLFGFHDRFGANFAGLALAVEIAGVVVLLAAAALRVALDLDRG